MIINNIIREEKIKKILEQYSLWLENSESFTKHQGEDVFNRIRGFFDLVFKEVVEDKNLIRLLLAIQKEMKIDLGVCPFLNDCESICQLSGNFVVNFLYCVPPLRMGCEYREKNQEE